MDFSPGPKRLPKGQPGPKRLPKGRPGPKPIPPWMKRESPEELRQYQPMRRPAVPFQPRRVLQDVTPEMLAEALAAVARGEGMGLPTQKLPVRIAPAVREAMEHSGLGQEDLQRFYDRLAEGLSTPEAIAQLPHWPERPEYVIYQDIFRAAKILYVVRFAIAPSEQGPIVAACEYSRISGN